MELRKASKKDLLKVCKAIGYKTIGYLLPEYAVSDFLNDRLYVVAEGEKVLACVSIVPEKEYGYTAIKRLCILNKKNQRKGIARFALQEVIKIVKGKIGATPWTDNTGMRRLLETEGFQLEYIFNERWCFYARETLETSIH